MIQELTELQNIDFYAQNIYAGPQIWKDGDVFRGYEKTPRLTCELAIFCSDALFTYKSDGKTLCARRGDVLFVPNKTKYTVCVEKEQNERQIDSYIVSFTLTDTLLSPLDFGGTIRKICTDRDGEILRQFKDLSFYSNGTGALSLKKTAAFYTLVEKLTSSENPEEYYPIKKAISVLNLEWNKCRPIEYYAALCSMSEGYFYKLFKEATGKSPAVYRNEIRINRAKALLLSADLKIGEIAAYCGFEDSFYFSRVFAKLVGKSPLQFKKDGK